MRSSLVVLYRPRHPEHFLLLTGLLLKRRCFLWERACPGEATRHLPLLSFVHSGGLLFQVVEAVQSSKQVLCQEPYATRALSYSVAEESTPSTT